jgi:hypothetical protein
MSPPITNAKPNTSPPHSPSAPPPPAHPDAETPHAHKLPFISPKHAQPISPTTKLTLTHSHIRTIPDLNHRDLIRRLPIQIIPLLLLGERKRSSLASLLKRVFEEVARVHVAWADGLEIHCCEGPIEDGAGEGAPDAGLELARRGGGDGGGMVLYHLEAAFEQVFDVFVGVDVHFQAAECAFFRLVAMDLCLVRVESQAFIYCCTIVAGCSFPSSFAVFASSSLRLRIVWSNIMTLGAPMIFLTKASTCG